MTTSEELLALLANPPRARAVFKTGQSVTGIFKGWKLGDSYQATVTADGVTVSVDGLYQVNYSIGARFKTTATTSYGMAYITVNGKRQSDVGPSGVQATNQKNCQFYYGGKTTLDLKAGDKVGVELTGTAFLPATTDATNATTWLTVEYWSPGKALTP